MNAPTKIFMSAEDFLAWGAIQPQGRFELVDGEVVMMSPEKARHVRAKYAIARALEDAILAADADCTFYGDGIGIRIGDSTVREPDASIQLGSAVDDDALLLDRPVIVVEVISPSSERADSSEKLVDYFQVPTIQHYLVVDAMKRCVIHHARAGGEGIATKVFSEGTLSLTPPGIVVEVADLFGTERKVTGTE